MSAEIKPHLGGKRATWAGMKFYLGGKWDHMGWNKFPSMGGLCATWAGMKSHPGGNRHHMDWNNTTSKWEKGPHGVE